MTVFSLHGSVFEYFHHVNLAVQEVFRAVKEQHHIVLVSRLSSFGTRGIFSAGNRPGLSRNKYMRIVSGSARGKRLASFSGQKIRPTSDRIREAVFSSLYSHIGPLERRRVLDLFAGTGAMGIEALSRGAGSAVFVDHSIQAVRVIQENLQCCGFPEKSRIFHKDVLSTLVLLRDEGPFDIIFMDPPYGKGLIEKTLTRLTHTGLLGPEGVLCVETSAEEEVSRDFDPFILLKKSRYGSTRVHLFRFSIEGGES